MCINCKYCFYDSSVDYMECNCECISEELILDHMCDMKSGCPYYTPLKTEEEIEAENAYYERLLAE